MKKPQGILYGVNEKVSFPLAVGMGLQHCLAMSSTLALAVILVEIAGETPHVALDLVRLSMVAAGVGTILQSLNRGPVGSGYLCPNLPGPAYLPASIVAVQTGGMSLLFCMICVAGVFQAILSRFVHKLRSILPPEVTGVIVSMVGMSLVPVGVSNLVGQSDGNAVGDVSEMGLGLLTLAVMIGFTVWGKRFFSLYSVLIGVAIGYTVQIVFDLGPDYPLLAATNLSLVSIPRPHLPANWTLDAALLIPFMIAGLASLVKAVGDLSTAQRINDETWVRPDMNRIRGGVLADSLSVITAGLIGGMAPSTSSSNVGVSLATGVTSRWIGFSAGALFILCSFFPIISTTFVVLADPVKGAVLIYAACFMIVTGLQLVMTRLLDARKIFVVGSAIAAGLSVDMLPEIYRSVPPAFQAFTTSSFSFAVVVAVVLNLIFRIGISRRATLEISPGSDGLDKVVKFLHDKGAAWGARADVISRVSTALTEFIDIAAPMDQAGHQVRINARFDQFRLDIYLLYGGEPIDLPETAPDVENIAAGENHLRQLSGFLIRSAATSVKSTQRGNLNMLHLRFDH